MAAPAVDKTGREDSGCVACGIEVSTRLPRVEAVVDRRRFLIDRARGQSVVHLGCVDEGLTAARACTGDLLHEELVKVTNSLVGVDLSESGLALLSSIVPGRYVQGDVEHLTELPLPDRCDLVLAPEIIEHVGNPARFLEELRLYLSTSGARAVITTPNAYSWKHNVRFLVRRREYVHPDHRCVYSPATLTRSLAAAGLEPVAVYAHAWIDDGRPRSLAGIIDRGLLRWNPLLGVGLVVEVVGR